MEWIPCKEKLPEQEGCYLVSVENDHKRKYSKTAWFSKNSNWLTKQKVLAWMYLPEPYKPF